MSETKNWTKRERELAAQLVAALRNSGGPYVEDNPPDLEQVHVDGPCNFLLLARQSNDRRGRGMISGMPEGVPLTVGDIRDAIQNLTDDIEINFGSTIAGRRLHFFRFKTRGEKLLGIELREEGT